jgi:hypothetical protein
MLRLTILAIHPIWDAISVKKIDAPQLVDFSVFFWDKILVWPRAILIHIPTAFRNVRQIKQVLGLIAPEIKKIQTAFFSVCTMPIFNTEMTRLLVEKLNEVQAQMNMISHEEVFEYLKDKGGKLHKLSCVMNEILNASDDCPSGVDVLEEASITVKLLATLIDDLASRDGLMSCGKRREAEPVTPASSPTLFSERPAAAVSFTEPHEEKVLKFAQPRISKTIWIKSVSSPETVKSVTKVSIATDDRIDAELLLKIQKIQNKYPFSIKNAVINFFRFIILDILLGIPRFILFELPEMIINFQNRLQHVVDHMDVITRSFLEIRNDLLALIQLLDSVKFLEPFFHGLFLFIKEQDLKESFKVTQKFDAAFDKICSQIDEPSLEKMQSMVVDLKVLLKRVKPMLENFLEAIEGRSIAAVLTPNPLGKMFKKPKAAQVVREEAPRKGSFEETAALAHGVALVPARPSPAGSSATEVERLAVGLNSALGKAPQSVTEIFGAIKTAFSAPRN